MSKSLIRKNQLHPDISDLVGQYGSGFFITSGDLDNYQFTTELTGANVVYTTGNQTLSGVKNFASRPTVNGTGVLLSGDGVNQTFVPTLYLRTSSQDTNGNNAGGIVSAISEDGIKWTSLSRNVNFPSFSRDASTIWYNNQWVSVYTNAFTSTGKNFGIATSTNLTSWVTGAPVSLTGSATTGVANNVWAPEWFVDNNEYYVLVRLSTTSGNNYGAPGVGYVKSLNPGTWTSWGPWIPFDNSVRIDANDFYIVKKENLYWLFSHGGTHLGGKQPTGLNTIQNITLQYSATPFSGYSSLVEITGPLRNIIRPGNGSAFFEGPSVINIEGSHWRLYFQDGLNNSLWSVDSFDDFQSWPTGSLRKNLYEGFNGAGHGTVLKVNESNYVGVTQSLLNINSPVSIGAVALTGNQSISGTKTFNNNLIVLGDFSVSGRTIVTEVIDVTTTGSISGSIGIFDNLQSNNVVFNTGNQTISGNKTFINTITINTISGTSSSSNSLNLIAANNTAPLSNPGDINLTAGTGVFSPNYGSINLNAGGVKYNGNINLKGNIEINYAGFGDPTLASRTINIYKTGTVFGAPSAIAGLTIDNDNISLNDPGFGAQGFGLLISGVPVTPALYATITNLASTGSTLDTKINNLSGVSVLTFGNQTINGLKTFASGISVTGGIIDLIGEHSIGTTAIGKSITLQGGSGIGDGTFLSQSIGGNITLIGGTAIGAGIPGNSPGNITLIGASGNTSAFIANGADGNGRINIYAAPKNNDPQGGEIVLKGNTYINPDFTRSREFIIYKSGDAGLSTARHNLTVSQNSVNVNNLLTMSGNPVLTGSSTLYATSVNLASTGSTLQTNINNLSGYINSTNSNIVFTTGNQAISGDKTFFGTMLFSGSGVNHRAIRVQNLQRDQFIDLGVGGSAADFGTRVFISSGNTNVTSIFRAGAVPTAYGYGIVFGGGEFTNKKGYLTLGSSLNPTGLNFATLVWTDRILSGQWRTNQRLLVNETGVVLSGEAVSPSTLSQTGATLDVKINTLSGYVNSTSSNIVYTTGNQNITGVKTFLDTIKISQNRGIGIDDNSNQFYGIYGLSPGSTSPNAQVTGLSIYLGGSEKLRLYNNGHVAFDDLGFMPTAANNSGYKIIHFASNLQRGATAFSMASKALHTVFFGNNTGQFILGTEARPGQWSTLFPSGRQFGWLFKSNLNYFDQNIFEGGTTQFFIDAQNSGNLSGLGRFIDRDGTVSLDWNNRILSGVWRADRLTINNLSGTPCEFLLACSDESTDLAPLSGAVTFRAPYQFTITGVRSSVNTAPIGSNLIVDINKDGVSIFSTKLSIDVSGKTSLTSTTPAVISSGYITDDSEITIDIDQVGTGTAGKGLKVTLYGVRL